ncbi:MAG TPA: UDP-N-acetylglucosamine 4,6-dehydratase (inverting) [Parachlamydiaceae bacterium]|nr:UDP-N-acetylglucosamine 4,6-dehydratase (inverting) [Parachlamydiaceae bacterium]
MKSSSLFKNKSVLITGGTGSFGNALAKRLLKEDICSKVIIFSRDEWKQHEMLEIDPIFKSSKIRYFLGDVRDKNRLQRAFSQVDFIIHAAALKQVPAAEYNPAEFIKTNVLGAMNLIDAAIDCGVEKVIALSTDKAANPINLYGATKLCSDKLFVAGNSYVGASEKPCFSVVRYGNVAASRGSVIPFWRKLLLNGATSLPVTDERMTRFWITLEEAVSFVIQCLENARGGEIFVPKISSVRISDVAKAMKKGIKLEITGIREGEKLHELMIGQEDARHTLEYDNHYIIVPEIYTHNQKLLTKFLKNRKGKKLPCDFSYASNTNTSWLNQKEIEKFLQT